MGQYDLIEWVIHKYSSVLPYQNIHSLSKHLNYNRYPRWKRDGIPRLVVAVVIKDLMISKLLGRLPEDEKISIKELRAEFKNINKPI